MHPFLFVRDVKTFTTSRLWFS